MTASSSEQLKAEIERLRQRAKVFRSAVWFMPVSARDMNYRERWLADQFDEIADRLASLGEGERQPEQEQEQVNTRVGDTQYAAPLATASKNETATRAGSESSYTVITNTPTTETR